MSDKYFQGGGVTEKTLRFFNLIEPGPNMVLSLSKLFLWVMMFAFILLIFISPGNLYALGPTSAGLLAAITNYGYRRKKQYEAGTPPYPCPPPPPKAQEEPAPVNHVMPNLAGNGPKG